MKIKILKISENCGSVNIMGTTEGLGERKVEIIINNDLNMRYIANNKDDGTWECDVKLKYNGVYNIEASIRDYSDFDKIRQTTTNDSFFVLENSAVWGASVVKHSDGLYYMLFATWERHDGFSPDWYHYSQIGYAVSTKIDGPYIYQGKALDPTYSNTTNKQPVKWMFDGEAATVNVFHNPTVMHSKKDNRYYLYFMGTSIDDISKSLYIQRIGVAYADSPAGPWTVTEKPVIDARKNAWDSGRVSNPSVIEMKNSDGEYVYYTTHKGVGFEDGKQIVATGYGISSSPFGPFERADEPIMRDPNVGFSVEDSYVWANNGTIYAMAKDCTKGNFTGIHGAYSYALFESKDGAKWKLSENKLAFKNEILWDSGTESAAYFERAQLYIEDGIPFMLMNACTVNGLSPFKGNRTCNIRHPLLGVKLACDVKSIKIKGLSDKTVNPCKLTALLRNATNYCEKDFEADKYKSFVSAIRAAEIILRQKYADQHDIDFIYNELNRIISQIGT